MLAHCMTLVCFRLFLKNFDNLREFFGQMVHRSLWQKIARTPMTECRVSYAQLGPHTPCSAQHHVI